MSETREDRYERIDTVEGITEAVDDIREGATQARSWMESVPANDDPRRCPPAWLNANAPPFAADGATQAAHAARRLQGLLAERDTLASQVATLTAEVERLRGCDGNCSCAVWTNIHETAMMLYATHERADVEKARAEAAEAALATVQNAAQTLVAGADARAAIATAHEPEARIAIATLDSERAMNAQLTTQLEVAEARVTALVAVLRPIVSVDDPYVSFDLGESCRFCFAARVDPHDDNCPWVLAHAAITAPKEPAPPGE